MKQAILFLIATTLLALNIYGQETFQTFNEAGFKIDCNCELEENVSFIKTAKQRGLDNVVAAYTCMENDNRPEIGVIYSVTVYDESNDYFQSTPEEYEPIEQEYLEEYAHNLKLSNVQYTYINFLGKPAIVYTQVQKGLPTQVLLFLNDKKSYLIKLGTQQHLRIKFDKFINSLVLIE